MTKTKDIQEAHLRLVKDQAKLPGSIGELARKSEIDRTEIKKRYSSIFKIEQDIWQGWFLETLSVLESSEEYQSYGAQERLFAFYYTWIETLEPHQQYVELAARNFGYYFLGDVVLSKMEKAFAEFSKELVAIALETGEVKNRSVLNEQYSKVFWPQLIFVLNHWLHDKSEEKVRTDEAIERAVSLSFEFLGRNPLDSIFELGKFLIQGSNERAEEDTNG